MNKLKFFNDLNTLHADCRVLKKAISDEDIKAKINDMQIRITGLIIELKEVQNNESKLTKSK